MESTLHIVGWILVVGGIVNFFIWRPVFKAWALVLDAFICESSKNDHLYKDLS